MTDIKPPLTSAFLDGATDSDAVAAFRNFAALAALIRGNRFPRVPTGLQRAIGASEWAERTRFELAAPSETPGQVVDRIARGVMAGDEPNDFVQESSDAWLSHNRRESAVQALAAVERSLVSLQRKAVEAALPELFAGLRDELSDVVDQLRGAYEVLGPINVDAPEAEAIIARTQEPVMNAWRSVIENTARYRSIRTAQFAALLASGVKAIGWSALAPTNSWQPVFKSGILEVKRPGMDGLNSAGLGKREAVKVIVTRPDVWLPDIHEANQAWAAQFGTLDPTPPVKVRADEPNGSES